MLRGFLRVKEQRLRVSLVLSTCCRQRLEGTGCLLRVQQVAIGVYVLMILRHGLRQRFVVDCHEVTLIQLGSDIIFPLGGIEFLHVLHV